METGTSYNTVPRKTASALTSAPGGSCGSAQVSASAGEHFRTEFDLEAECVKIGEASSESLESAGLVGAQLRLKLAVVEHFG